MTSPARRRTRATIRLNWPQLFACHVEIMRTLCEAIELVDPASIGERVARRFERGRFRLAAGGDRRDDPTADGSDPSQAGPGS